jgi:hypothetical protein
MPMKDKLKFLPLLLLYMLIIWATSTDVFYGDEARYVAFATNLTNGYYSPPDHVNLWNGPGYPIVLAPFILLKLPLFSAKLLNALFLFGAILYFYGTLRLYGLKRSALFCSYLLGLYPPFFRYIQYVLTETLSIFLVCGFVFHFCRLHRGNRSMRADLVAASAYFAYLALTKIFYGYVILTALLVALIAHVWKRGAKSRKTLFVCCLALICCIPYLSYTYALTGKVFYWGNSGGSSLYWMSTPYENELGSWFSREDVAENPEMLAKHQEFFREIDRLPSIERDEELKRRAIQNISSHPGKYIRNWMANVGRMLFNYPYSFSRQKLSTYFYIAPNMFVVVVGILLLYPTYRGRKLIPYEIYALLLFVLISFGGSSLLSGSTRQFMLLVPVLLFWMALTFTRVLRVEIRT